MPLPVRGCTEMKFVLDRANGLDSLKAEFFWKSGRQVCDPAWVELLYSVFENLLRAPGGII